MAAKKEKPVPPEERSAGNKFLIQVCLGDAEAPDPIIFSSNSTLPKEAKVSLNAQKLRDLSKLEEYLSVHGRVMHSEGKKYDGYSIEEQLGMERGKLKEALSLSANLEHIEVETISFVKVTIRNLRTGGSPAVAYLLSGGEDNSGREEVEEP